MRHSMSTGTTTANRTEKGRAYGAFVGALVGDALGAPFEFRAAGLYSERFPNRVLGGVGEMVGGGGFGWAPGEFTDDSQMGMALAEALLEAKAYDPDVVWKWFRAWSATATDMGMATRTSLSFDDWRSVQHGGQAAGNGALMRAFTLALAFLNTDDAELHELVMHESALTHNAPSAGAGAWIAVQMMRVAIRGGDPLAALPSILATLSPSLRDEFAPLVAPEWKVGDSPSNGSVWGCLAQAVYCLRTTSTFEDAVTTAVNMGGDTDTVACVAGALAGAVYGVQAIPSRWTTYVHGWIDGPHGRVEYRLADVLRIAARLIGSREPKENAPDAPAGPQEVAPGLFAANIGGAANAPLDWAVVSLCRTGDVFEHHPVRRQVFLVDQEGDHNPGLEMALRDAVDAVQAFLDEGRSVVVHCHGGHSRTGLVLKAWHMRATGCTEREAHEWLAARWPLYQDYNASFRAVLGYGRP